MFRSITAILLLVAFATQTFERTFLVLDYYANARSFAQQCENKFRPQMHCNGKCLLMKKLKEQENKDQRAPERKSENKSEVIPSASWSTLTTAPVISLNTLSYPSLINAPLSKGSRAIFHPPDA